MATVEIGFTTADTGLTISDISWEYCSMLVDGAIVAVPTVNCTMVELGNGHYLLTNPDVTALTSFYLYLTADSTKYIPGEFAADDAIAAAVLAAAQATPIHADSKKVAGNVMVGAGTKTDKIRSEHYVP